MHKTPIILIKKNRKEMYVSKYMVRRTNGGQLVLDLIKYMGNLHTLSRLNTEEAYFAITDIDYYSEEANESVTTKIGEGFKQIGQTKNVVVTLNDKDRMRYSPYTITIFCNNVYFQRLEEYNANFEPSEDEIIMQFRSGEETEYFKFGKKNRASVPDLSNLILERNTYYASVQNVGWFDRYNYYKVGQVFNFTVQWAKEMLTKLRDIDNEDIVYPTLSGEWIVDKTDREKKVLPRELYGKELTEKAPTKIFWEWYLSVFDADVSVAYSQKFPEGRVIWNK